MSKSTVHQYKKVWWFWDESKRPRKRIGSYTSKVGAQKGLSDWIERLERQRIQKNNSHNELIIDELTHLMDESQCTCLDEINQQCSHCQEIIHNV